jgi:hypothetical protein
LEDTVAAEVEKKLKAMNIGTQQVAQIQPAQTITCETCNGPHHIMHCFANPQQIKMIKFLKQKNTNSNTYNLGWKNHPNFSWNDQRGNVLQ